VLAAVPRVLALLKTHLESTLPGLAERAAGPKGTATGVSVLRRWARFRDVHAALGLNSGQSSPAAARWPGLSKSSGTQSAWWWYRAME